MPRSGRAAPGSISQELLLETSVADFASFHIDPSELDDLIGMHGIACRYRRAVICPCARIETNQPRAGCPNCNGLGFLYPKDLEDEIVALVLNRNPRRTAAAPGEFITGSVVITFPLGTVPGRGDMVLPTLERHTVHQLVRRAEMQVDPVVVASRATAPDHAAPKVGVAGDRLLYPDIVEVDDCYWLDEDQGLHRGKAGADFVLKSGAVTWKDGHGPKPGRAYSVRYMAPAAYVVYPSEPLLRAEAENFYTYRAEAQRLDRWGSPDLRG